MTTNANGYIMKCEDNGIRYVSALSTTALYNRSNLGDFATAAVIPATAQQLLTGFVSASGISAGTEGHLGLPTAQEIVNAIPKCVPGMVFECMFENAGTKACTIDTAVGLTLKGTLSVGIGATALLRFIVRNVTSAAVTVITNVSA
jgi:hypothetical protein